jgi:hypothetical protein
MMAVNAFQITARCEGDSKASDLPTERVHHRHQKTASIAASIRTLFSIHTGAIIAPLWFFQLILDLTQAAFQIIEQRHGYHHADG